MKKSRSPLFVTTLIAGAFFMENLDGTIIATALPQMAHSFHVGAVNLNIGMTAYLITLAVFIPISGWVADRFGSRSVFAAAIATFTVASLLCGAAHTLTQFTLMRPLLTSPGPALLPLWWAHPSAALSPPMRAGTGSSFSIFLLASSP